MNTLRILHRTAARRGLTLLLVIVGLLLGGCEVVTNQETGIASQRVKEYLSAIQAGQFHKAASMYPADQVADWEHFMEGVRDRLGRLKSYDLDGPETNIVFSGKFYIFTLDGEYEHGSTEEVITLFQGLDEPLPHLDYHKITKEHRAKPKAGAEAVGTAGPDTPPVPASTGP